VSDRNESAFSKRAEYDSEYDETMSFRKDLWLLWSTVSVVLRGTGY
jgi:exopolysaccharide production protein ExoY